MKQYWKANGMEFVIPLYEWNELPYVAIPGLTDVIRAFHNTIGVPLPTNYTIVVSGGSTGALSAFITIMANRLLQQAFAPVYVYCQPPFYFGYINPVGAVGTATAGLVRFTSDKQLALDNLQRTIQIITVPNNPNNEVLSEKDAVLRDPSGRTPFAVATDYAYLGPGYTIDETVPYPRKPWGDFMLFTLTKCVGMGGSRVGYAVVKDPDVALQLEWFIVNSTLGISSDSQARARAVLTSPLLLKGIYQFRSYLINLWDLLVPMMTNNPYFSLAGKKGAYLWVECKTNCTALFDKMKIKIQPGSSFGATDNFGRLTLIGEAADNLVLLSRLLQAEQYIDHNICASRGIRGS